MSPRAAWRLISLGFTRVYDYVAGKMDWLGFGLSTEGALADQPRAGSTARRDVPRCGLQDRLGEVRERVQAAGWDECAVVNDEDVLLGLLRGKHWESSAESIAEDVMSEGPATIRPSEPLEAIAGRMQDRDVSAIFVTDSAGVLIGLLRREDAERVLGEQ